MANTTLNASNWKLVVNTAGSIHLLTTCCEEDAKHLAAIAKNIIDGDLTDAETNAKAFLAEKAEASSKKEACQKVVSLITHASTSAEDLVKEAESLEKYAEGLKCKILSKCLTSFARSAHRFLKTQLAKKTGEPSNQYNPVTKRNQYSYHTGKLTISESRASPANQETFVMDNVNNLELEVNVESKSVQFNDSKNCKAKLNGKIVGGITLDNVFDTEVEVNQCSFVSLDRSALCNLKFNPDSYENFKFNFSTSSALDLKIGPDTVKVSAVITAMPKDNLSNFDAVPDNAFNPFCPAC